MADLSCPYCKHYGPAVDFLSNGAGDALCPSCCSAWPYAACQQIGCRAPAVARFNWPAVGWKRACEPHTRRAIEVAAAMGFGLVLDEIGDPEPEARANPRRCFACDAKLKVCNITRALSEGGRCCADCRHPDPLSPVDA